MDFTNRVVLVTGASRGLGRATAMRFLELGATVAVNARTEERARALASGFIALATVTEAQGFNAFP